MNDLPDGWCHRRLGDVLEILIDHRGQTPGKLGGAFQTDGVPVISAIHIKEGRVDFSQRARFVSLEMFERWMPERLRAGDVLLTSEAPMGSVALVPSDAPLVLSQRLFALRGHASLLENRYLRWALEAQSIRDQLDRRSSGTTVTGIRQSELVQVELPLPPLSEQRRIVDTLEDHLSSLDAAEGSFVSIRAKLIALRDAIISSALFADLAGEADPRLQVTVGEVADVDTGPAFKSSVFGGPGEGTRLLRGDNIEPGSLRWGRTKSWPDSQLQGFEHLLVAEGDIILAMDRPVVSAGLKLARVTPADTPALLVQRVARIRPHASVAGDFLHQILGSRHFVHQLLGNQVGTQIPHITMEAIRKFAFLLPEPAVQIAVAKQVRAHIESIERVERDIALASTRSHSLRRALLAAAFSGRITGRSTDMEMVEEMAGV